MRPSGAFQGVSLSLLPCSPKRFVMMNDTVTNVLGQIPLYTYLMAASGLHSPLANGKGQLLSPPCSLPCALQMALRSQRHTYLCSLTMSVCGGFLKPFNFSSFSQCVFPCVDNSLGFPR